MSKILAFAGSAREKSFNKKMVNIAAAGAEQAGAEVTLVDLADYPMPIFDEDLEGTEGMPETAKALKALMVEHQGLLIASPEYNSAFSPLLKNTLDWVSRPAFKGDKSSAYQGKYATIMATSPGALGGIRGLVFVRMLLGNLGVTVLPDQLAVPSAFKAFADDGSLADVDMQQKVMALGSSLARELSKQ